MQLSGVRDGERTGHGGGHGRREVRWLPSHPAVGTSRVAVSPPWPAASVAHWYPCWSCYWCYGRLFDVVSYSGTHEEKERDIDIDSYGVMLLVVMSAFAACQVRMVHQCVLDRVATAPSLLFRPLVPSSSIPSSRLSPTLLRSCSPSHPLSLLVVSPLSSSVCTQFSSLPCGFSGSRFALFGKTRTFTKRFNEWWEWTTRFTAATEAVGTTFPALLQGRCLKGLINFGGSIWFAMERLVAIQWRAGHTASVRHSESLADRSTFHPRLVSSGVRAMSRGDCCIFTRERRGVRCSSGLRGAGRAGTTPCRLTQSETEPLFGSVLSCGKLACLQLTRCVSRRGFVVTI